MKHTILLGLTTTPGSDWQEKCREIDKYGIEELALFPTFLGPPDREKLYKLLQKSSLKSIPHVHLRNDHTDAEIMFFVEKYGTKLFNIHDCGLETMHRLKRLGLPTYIENGGEISADFEKILATSNGLCFDFSHFEAHYYRAHEEQCEPFVSIIDRYKIGCCHVSAVTKELMKNFDGNYTYSSHKFYQLEDLDYVKNYIKYFSKYVSLELENSFKQQLEAKAYIEQMIAS
ncbi:MAG: hypothetical protein WCO23_03800 [bacterium]